MFHKGDIQFIALLFATAVFGMVDHCHTRKVKHGWEMSAYGDFDCGPPPVSMNYFNGDTLRDGEYSKCNLFFNGVQGNLQSFIFNAESRAYVLIIYTNSSCPLKKRDGLFIPGSRALNTTYDLDVKAFKGFRVWRNDEYN
ncbi:hypothetical protein BJ138DRAFT_1160761, partial [Hygrophoropsis aurantiaca]